MHKQQQCTLWKHHVIEGAIDRKKKCMQQKAMLPKGTNNAK